MDVINAVYRQWSEDLQDSPEPAELTKAYRMFQKELNQTTVMTNSRKDDIFEAMVYCMTVASEFSFKEGFKAGMQLLRETR